MLNYLLTEDGFILTTENGQGFLLENSVPVPIEPIISDQSDGFIPEHPARMTLAPRTGLNEFQKKFARALPKRLPLQVIKQRSDSSFIFNEKLPIIKTDFNRPAVTIYSPAKKVRH